MVLKDFIILGFIFFCLLNGFLLMNWYWRFFGLCNGGLIRVIKFGVGLLKNFEYFVGVLFEYFYYSNVICVIGNLLEFLILFFGLNVGYLIKVSIILVCFLLCLIVVLIFLLRCVNVVKSDIGRVYYIISLIVL